MCASLVLRVCFSWYMLIFVPIDEVITWDLENFVTISLPAWAISGTFSARDLFSVRDLGRDTQQRFVGGGWGEPTVRVQHSLARSEHDILQTQSKRAA